MGNECLNTASAMDFPSKALWTIFILTINGRENYLKRLRGLLDPQLNHQVDVVVLKDNREHSIGEKRQYAVDNCTTKYINFIDDDDIIAGSYVDKILHWMRRDAYGVGFRGIITMDGKIPVEFIHKAGLPYSEKPVRYDGAMRYTRPLNHLNPVMTSIAKEIGYKPISMGEDRDYSIRLAESGLVQDDCLVNDYLYFYQYRSKK